MKRMTPVRLAAAGLVFVALFAAGAGVLFSSDDDGTDEVLLDDRRPEASKELDTINAKAQGKLPAAAGKAKRARDEEAEPPEETDAEAWKLIAATMEMKGVLKDGVFTFTVPRDDLDVTVEGNEVPAAAGLESQFRFYRCPCGKINVIGQFCVADYEANDVVDALREGHVVVASVGPLLMYERPRLMLIRFQGEGRGATLAATLKAALSWTGEARMAPQKLDVPEEGPEEKGPAGPGGETPSPR